MIFGGRRASILLFMGDLAVFVAALYLTLWLRYGVQPTFSTLEPFLSPFAFLFTLWVLVFYSAGLYSKRSILFAGKLLDALIKTQIVNIVLAALFFFLIPAFGIAPKIILVLYFAVSLILVLVWRLALYPRISTKRSLERAMLMAGGPEADELFKEVNSNPRYGIEFVHRARGSELTEPDDFLVAVKKERPSLLVADTSKEAAAILPAAYHLTNTEKKCHFLEFGDVYEEIFDRIPLSALKDVWFLENVSSQDPLFYVVVKKIIDLIGGVLMGIITMALMPFIALANWIEGTRPLFIAQQRFGRFGVPMVAYKFRSMHMHLPDSGEWTNEGTNKVTKVGAFLRQTSLDEFPQFVNILRGEISLVGPRNDTLGLGRRLAEALPYYEARYMVMPGITGWAQINQQYEPGNASPQSVEETKTRLAYDFYYLKHRSLGLDLIIALKTIKRMFFRVSAGTL